MLGFRLKTAIFFTCAILVEVSQILNVLFFFYNFQVGVIVHSLIETRIKKVGDYKLRTLKATMDYFGVPHGSIRSEALKKLAILSVENTPTNLQESPNAAARDNFALLLMETPKESETIEEEKSLDSDDESDGRLKKLSQIAITPKEYEVLIALCDSTETNMKFPKQAKLLLSKLRLYLLELPNQKFSSAITNSIHNSSPWLILGEKLTSALVNLAYKFDSLFIDDVLQTFSDFNTVIFKDQAYELSNYFTILGVIQGFTKNAKLLTEFPKAFKIFMTLDTCIDNFEFLNDVEIYSNSLYSHPDNNYSSVLDEDFVIDFSPVLFIECLSKLMCSMLNSILVNEKEPLLDFLLSKVSSKFDEVGNGTSISSSLPETSSGLDISEYHMGIIKSLSDIAVQKMEFLDRGETYIVYSTFTRLKIGYLAKSYNLQAISCGTFTDNINVKAAKKIFKNCLSIYDVMLDPNLGSSVIQLGSLLVYKDPSISSPLTRAFTSLVANPKFTNSYCLIASKSVGMASKVLSQDSVVTTIYALTNLLFVGNNDGTQAQLRSRRNTGIGRFDSLSRDSKDFGHNHGMSRQESLDSINENGHANGNHLVSDNISKQPIDYDESDYNRICENAITAIIHITEACNDETVSTLAVTILSQKTAKLDSPIGPLLLKGLVSCAPFLPDREFIILVKLLHKLSLDSYESNNYKLSKNLIDARVSLSRKLLKNLIDSRSTSSSILKQSNELYTIYLREILIAIISKGDVQVLDHHRPHDEISEIGDQIGIYLKPLSELLPNVNEGHNRLIITDTSVINLFRNIWFNMVVHGYSINSKNVNKYNFELERIAYNTPPLASELSWDRTETSLELNTVLRRGSSNHNVKDHKHIIGDVFEVPRTISYPKLMFLSATIFVESLRVKLGDCSTILQYFSDPSIKTSNLDKYIGYISFKIGKDFIYLITCGANKQFSSENIAEQLTNMLALCCHRIEDLQDASLQCCDLLINKIPSSLCHHKSLFALFDLLTLLFDSIIDEELNQYEPTFIYKAAKTGIQIDLNDSYSWRLETFNRFLEKCKNWVKLILLKCNFDAKSLIQSYVSDLDRFQSNERVQYGVSFAIELAGGILPNDRELSNILGIGKNLKINLLPIFTSQLSWRSNFVSELMDKVSLHTQEDKDKAFRNLRQEIFELKINLENNQNHIKNEVIIDLLSEIAGFALISDENSGEMIRYLVDIPFEIFETHIMQAAIGIWFAVMKDKPDLSVLILLEISKKWEISIELKKGLFNNKNDIRNPEFNKMEYLPSDFKNIKKKSSLISKNFKPHSTIIKLFQSNFEATLNQSDHLLKIFTKFIEISLKNFSIASLHPFSRFVRFELIRFSFDILNYHIKLGTRNILKLSELILDGSLSWFKSRANYPYGVNNLKIKADYGLLKEVTRLISNLNTFNKEDLELKKIILLFFLDDEISKISVWLNPINPSNNRGSYISNQIGGQHIKKAYSIDPILSINLAYRYKIKNLDELLQQLITSHPIPSINYPDAVQYFIGINAGTNMPSHHLLFWEPLSPCDSITLFLPPFGKNPYILQYTMRSLETHDVNLTFFYVPQIVQSLRFDAKGYVQRFIIETAKISQLFAHQIIWNMLANSYKDEDSIEPDSLKPKLDEIQNLMLKNVSEEDYEFYQREFSFFNEVTNISGKLKPYIKKTKAEKKVKIDEEMSKIEVKEGVYLPSNPDGIVSDINRKSGKPLQSHAKAPFMATFRIKKEVEEINEFGEIIQVPIEKWQGAIFKVGDDCRQDVLALQLISVFRTIWSNCGLDLFVYPYRVTATAPGCGVIDVLPNSVSRDMLGREAVNGLYEYYITKFGPENSIEFQQARNNLIRSLAAYSIISYLLQFKDRHNGNIMYDDQGHILHIDFGFCFDIVPGGVKFENVPFKLTHEMVLVMGGHENTQAFRWYEELCIKGYLACRPYMETIVRCVNPMLESGLPCFKETTIKKLRSRFVPNKSEKDASIYFRSLIKKSMESMYTKGYDEFQRITNGIPY